MARNNISMSDKDFAAPHNFTQAVKVRFNLSEKQAEFLVFSSWRKFKLILAKDRGARERLRGLLDMINELEAKK